MVVETMTFDEIVHEFRRDLDYDLKGRLSTAFGKFAISFDLYIP